MVKFLKLQLLIYSLIKMKERLSLVSTDDIDAAIGESIKLSMDILDKKATDIIDMKKE